MADVALRAVEDQKGFYDARYEAGYMQDFGHVFEATRLRQIEAILRMLRRQGLRPSTALDYGCGEGRWFGLLDEVFPEAALTGCDISGTALQLASTDWPGARLTLMDDERVDLPDGSCELLISVEVLEHVADVRRACAEMGRLLAPGGTAVVTTPCANPLSLEWLVNRARGGFEETPCGYGRFSTDEVSHLRRLRSRDLEVLLRASGLTVRRTLYAGHLFTTLMGLVPGRKPRRVRAAVGMLDWQMFRRLPNGSTMVIVAQRPAAPRL